MPASRVSGSKKKSARTARGRGAEVVLAGDVGATNARFALFALEGRKLLHQAVLPSQEHPSLEGALAAFLDEAPAATIRAASFGIAGPVVDQKVRTTNLPWRIDARQVAREFGIAHVTLFNDLVAQGLGALDAGPKKQFVVHLGRPKKTGGNLAVIAAGTGLGEASFIWDGQGHVPCPSEGSHVEFAPRTQLEITLLQELTKQYGHVSYERVASGSTIGMVYEFLLRNGRTRESRGTASQVAQAKDANVAVVELALAGKSEVAMRAVEMWSSVYGAEAGNLALKTLATSGVYVCGGASARLAEVLAHGLPARRGRGKTRGVSPFVEAFLDKGRMRPLVEQIPVAVILEPLAGLRGAAAHALKTARGER